MKKNRLTEIAFYHVGKTIIREAPEDELGNEAPLAPEELEGEIEASVEDEAITPEPVQDNTLDGGGEIELDVTDIVTKSQENASKIDAMQSMMNTKFQELTNLMQQMQSSTVSKQDLQDLDGKIEQSSEDLKHQIMKNNPDPIQKLELRSVSSAPFSMKLQDFWNEEIPDNYKIDYKANVKKGEMDNYNRLDEPDNEASETEYVLTDVDLMDDYTEEDVINALYK